VSALKTRLYAPRKTDRPLTFSTRKPLIQNGLQKQIMKAFAIGILTAIAFALRGATVSVVPDADSLLRSLAPTCNYGIGGALSVSGSAAANGSGDQNGLFDTLLRFPIGNATASLNSALGGEDWIVTEARLVLTEMAVPDNAMFNRGVGAFEIRWVASDGWLEGTGKPNAPTTDGVAWQDLSLILNSNVDESLGLFTNSGVNGQVSFNLALSERFIVDMHQDAELSLYLTARSPDIGFTFNSRNFGNTNTQPMLVITAAANPRPVIDHIQLAGPNHAAISFDTVSNWTYVLQGADLLPVNSAGVWSNLMTAPAQSTNGHAVFTDGITNRQRFYRLMLTQHSI
jgi:hypothetical protein